MKYIEKAIEDEQTGATAKYHEITALNIDYTSDYATVTVGSYVSLKARKAGKSALSFNSFTLQPLPDRAENPHDWALTQLIQSKPAEFVPDDYPGYVNPHTFADGEIKEG